MKKLLFVILSVIIVTGRALAGCDWATETPADDSQYKYFVSRVYSETSASDAAKKAEQDIDAQIGRLFGTKMDVLSEFYADETNVTGTTRSYERTLGAITLKGLERQKGDVEKKSKSWIGCVKYRYLKSEIESEQQRLKNMSADDFHKSLMFTEVAGDSVCRGAPVEVVTVPSGAYVTLDNGKYQGTAPIKFANVCDGKHSLEITHDNYEPVTQQLVVPTSGRITKTLVRATKKITVKTNLGDSELEINGVNKGQEPVVFKAQLGVEYTITATNSRAVKETHSPIFSKDSDSVYIISMEKAPSKIDFTAFKKRNPGVDIFVDGSKVNGNTSKELVEKEHEIRFSKQGYKDIITTVYVDSGETMRYSSSELNFSKISSQKSPSALYVRSNFGFFVGAEYGSDMLGGNIGIEYQYRRNNLYASIDLLINGLFGSYETQTIEHGYYTDELVDVSIGVTSFEYLRGSLGLNLSRKSSIFGIVSLGSIIANLEDIDADHIRKIFVRYGAGFGYTGNSGVGARIYFLTGATNISAPDFPETITTLGVSAFWSF